MILRHSLAVSACTAALLLGGCASTPLQHDPAWAPAMPVVQAPPAVPDGSIYKAGFDKRLFEDTKARQVGDIITITLTEKTDAAKQANTATSKQQNISSSGTLFGVQNPGLGAYNPLNNSISGSQDFTGDGASKQSNKLTGSITVTVWQVLPNGNLVVRGEKLVTLNQGDEYLRISGIIRPIDIKSDNTVESTKVANAQIIYSGEGAVASSNVMGWLGRFFTSVLSPF